LAQHDSHIRPAATAAETLTGTERDARIEQQLLAGLDAYFAGQYEQAITLWTRVLFLDRHHDRARAYIERARSAQAERQRETEAVLHQGIEAFHEGDVARARALVADALDRGASHDDAQGMLDRIERLGAGLRAPSARRRVPLPATTKADVRVTPSPARGRRGRSTALLLLTAAAGALAVAVWGFAAPEVLWPALDIPTAPAPATLPAMVEPLPLAGATEVFLARGRTLLATGRLRDALHELDRIPIGDTLHGEATRVRADVQRQLLAVAAAEHPPAPDAAALFPPRPPE
jgi:hypothetical protein